MDLLDRAEREATALLEAARDGDDDALRRAKARALALAEHLEAAGERDAARSLVEGVGAAAPAAVAIFSRGGGSSLRRDNEKWNPLLHPRDREGQFIEVLNQLVGRLHKFALQTDVDATRSLELPGGAKIDAKVGLLGEKFVVRDRAGKKVKTLRSFTGSADKHDAQLRAIAEEAMRADPELRKYAA